MLHISQGKFSWAMAGRDRQKLEKVRQELCTINPDMEVRRCVEGTHLGKHSKCYMRTLDLTRMH